MAGPRCSLAGSILSAWIFNQHPVRPARMVSLPIYPPAYINPREIIGVANCKHNCTKTLLGNSH